MSDAWEEIQAFKSKRNSFRERLEKRKKERQDILLGGNSTTLNLNVSSTSSSAAVIALSSSSSSSPAATAANLIDPSSSTTINEDATEQQPSPLHHYHHNNDSIADNDDLVTKKAANPELELELLRLLSEVTLSIPVTSTTLLASLRKKKLLVKDSSQQQQLLGQVGNLLQKFSTQKLITIKDVGNVESTTMESIIIIEVTFVDATKVNAMIVDCPMVVDRKRKTVATVDLDGSSIDDCLSGKRKRGGDDDDGLDRKSDDDRVLSSSLNKKDRKEPKADIMSLLSMPSTKEKESKKLGEEILDLLSKPTAKERSLAERFRSQGGKQLMEFCPHGTRNDCERNGIVECKKLHFKKIIQKHTDEALGDCSFLNTCFHMDTCKYVHYEVDRCCILAAAATQQSESHDGGIATTLQQQQQQTTTILSSSSSSSSSTSLSSSISLLTKQAATVESSTTLYPPQWVQCDLRYLDMTVLGKFAVIMADPPWDIHMELPYGTMSDDEMRQLGIPQLQDDGLIFLWVTGRAMELGRECLKLWGYERVDEIIWVKTNQLQRIIRTGRTGHWLNHGKEHCLVGMKGEPVNLNRGLDSDVIVAEVRATSHKPDEIYGMIERLSPGTRKIELFGRPHNIQPNWITLGNQVDGIRLVDSMLIENFRKRYPTGNCMAPPPNDTSH